MKTWRVQALGSLDRLVLEDVPAPEPGPGEVRVRVAHAGLNPADYYMALGQYPRPPKPPFAIGREASGTVETPVAGGRFAAGDPVVVLRSELGISQSGTLAEYVCVPEESLAPLPAGWSLEEAAAAPCTMLTAWRALVDLGGLRAGQTVLITGASGGVGTAAVPLVKGLGAAAVALSRDAAKRERLLALGADHTIDASREDWDEAVKAALGGGRVDLVLENVGGPVFERSLRVVGYGGTVLVVGLLAGVQPRAHLGLLIHKCLRVQGLSVGAYTPADAQRVWPDILAVLAKTGARPLVDRVYPMTHLHAAIAHLQRGPMGKVVVQVGGGVIT